jgi:hypothetical protein
MNILLVQPGAKVLLEPTDETQGLLAEQDYMHNRKRVQWGTLPPEGVIVRGFKGDVETGYKAAWVRHADGSLAPYWFHEMTLQ